MSYFPDSIMPPDRKDESQDVRGNKHIITGADHNKHDEAIIAVEKYITANEAKFSIAFSGMNTETGVDGFSGFSAFSGGFHLESSGQSNIDLLKFVVAAIVDAQNENVRTTSQVVPVIDPSLPGVDGTVDFPDSWDTLVTTLSQEITDDSVDEILADQSEIVGLGEDATLSDFFEIGELEIGDTSDMPETGYITLINHVSMRRPGEQVAQTAPLEASGFLGNGTADSFSPFEINIAAPSTPNAFGQSFFGGGGGIRNLIRVTSSLLTDNDKDFVSLGIASGSIVRFDSGINAGKTVTVASVAANQLALFPNNTIAADTNFSYSVYVVRTGALRAIAETSNPFAILIEAGADFAGAGIEVGMSIVFEGGANAGQSSVITAVGSDTLTLTYSSALIAGTVGYRLNSIFNLRGTIGGFSGLFMTHGFSSASGALGFSGTLLPPEDGTAEEQAQFDKMVALGGNVEILYYRGIEGSKLLRLSRERRGSIQGMHLAGDLVFKGELSIAAAPSMWVAKDDNSLGHLECFVDPKGKLKMATRDTEDFRVLDAENLEFAYAQFQATLVRNPLVQPIRIEEE